MIETVRGDLFSVTEGIIVHGCNAQGVMGSGVAKIVKELYFEAFKVYAGDFVNKSNTNEEMLGTITYEAVSNDLVVVNAVTQKYYGSSGQHTNYDAVRACFKLIVQEFKDIGPQEINFPLIGCGLGGGDWDVVSKIIDEEVDDTFIKRLWIL